MSLSWQYIAAGVFQGSSCMICSHLIPSPDSSSMSSEKHLHMCSVNLLLEGLHLPSVLSCFLLLPFQVLDRNNFSGPFRFDITVRCKALTCALTFSMSGDSDLCRFFAFFLFSLSLSFFFFFFVFTSFSSSSSSAPFSACSKCQGVRPTEASKKQVSSKLSLPCERNT